MTTVSRAQPFEKRLFLGILSGEYIYIYRERGRGLSLSNELAVKTGGDRLV